MNQARRCSAVFMKDRVTTPGGTGGNPGGTRAGLGGSGAGIASGGSASGTGGGSNAGASGGGRATDPLEGRGGAHAAPETDGKPDNKPDAAPPSAEAIAKDDIKSLLEAFRKAYESRDVPGIKRLYPTAPEQYLKGLQSAFSQYKSLEYTYSAPPEYLDLSPPVGTATVKVVALSKPEYKGPKDPPQKLANTFTLKRTDGTWTIQFLKTEPVK